MADILAIALAKEVLTDSDESVVFYDLSRLDDTLGALQVAFPATALHAVAVKANPTLDVLKRIRRAGMGAEVASLGELQLALAAGFPAESIVFDSPVKTRGELELGLRLGVRINANTLDELARIDRLHARLGSRSKVGIRINPETGKGAIDATSVAVTHSKFGVSLHECHSGLANAFAKYPWLTGLHMHIGSQGMSAGQLIDGVAAVYEFYMELKDRHRIDFFDIGGGLPVRYRDTDTPLRFDEYAGALRQRCPALFEPEICLITEFGRAVHAGCGWVASRIEYIVRHDEAISTIYIHVGADMFLRKAYRPDDWHHDIRVCDCAGKLRSGPVSRFHIAGPLCFAGDYVGRRVSLPATVREGDYVLIQDAGAYTFSMWSLYNSRQFPAIIGYEGKGELFRCLRPRQSPDDIVAFWSAVTTDR